MIKQYLSNKNENATVPEIKILGELAWNTRVAVSRTSCESYFKIYIAKSILSLV